MDDPTLEPALQAVIEAAPVPMAVLDPTFNVVAVNDALLAAAGVRRAALLGRNLLEAFPEPPGRERLRASLERVLETRKAHTLPARPDELDESSAGCARRCWNVSNHPVLDATGRLRWIVHRAEDVTERMAAEAARERLIAESERQRLIYEAALSNTPDLIYVFDPEHRFTYANEALLRMWGRQREDALGKTCLELGYEPWHAEMHDREIDEVIATRRPIRGEVPFTGTGGRRIYDYIFVPVVGVDGKVVAVAGTTRDVTERQQAEQEIRAQAERLRESDKAKDEFLATLAHELRNPLAPIANSIELMKRDHADGEISARARATMDRQVRHLVRLVDDLLDVSRITRGHLELRRQRVKLSTIVEQAVEASRPQIDAAGHTLTVTVPEESVWLDADPVRLVQVVGNLLNNASKYTPRGGRIELDARCSEGIASISVRDTGVGIAPEMLERVFDMFTRAEQSIEDTRDGLGVGLTLARRLVEMHGGTMAARSEGKGRGSEFTMRMPCVLEGGIDAAAAPEAAAGAARRVLVVDDNLDAASSLAALLDLSGNETRTVHDGVAAVAAAAEFRPDVILLDIGLPGMNGHDACRAIRRLPGGEDMLIVALTGWGQAQDRKTSSEAGFDTHLVKPADYSKLLQIIATEPRAARERT